MEEKKSIDESAEQLKKEVKDITDMESVHELLKDNMIEFDHKDVSYRAKKPTFKEKQLVNQKRIDKYVDLLKDKNNLLEADLKKLYKDRGIDVDEMDKEFDALDKKRQTLMLELGANIKEQKPKEHLEEVKEKIKAITEEMKKISLRKSVLMDSSIETQINVFVYTYIAFLVTEKLIEGKDLGEGNKEPDTWTKAWDKYEDFLEEEEGLVNVIVWYGTMVSKSELML